MKKHSCSYNGINPNFVISDFISDKKIDKTLSGILDILSNILMRGVPTFPSEYLVKNIGNPSEYKNTVYSFKENSDLCWNNIIKGGTTNPAIAFYKYFKKCYYSQYSYFLPECPMEDIIGNFSEQNEKIIKNSSVDFYSPFHKIVVEIDGSQHEEAAQKSLDQARDNLLKKAGCTIHRIPTTAKNKLELFSKLFTSTHDAYLSFSGFVIDSDHISDSDIKYMLIIRFQIAIIELLRHGILEVNNNYTIKILNGQDNDSLLSVAQIAYKDIRIWIENLYALDGEKSSLPIITFVCDDSKECDITIDIDCLSHYDESVFTNSDKYIYIRNDYFIYNRFAQSEPDIFAYSKNYYNVYSNNFRFNKISINDTNKVNALRFFLKNIFRFDDFRPKQAEIIASTLDPDNGTIGLLPTGSGKSICYQLAGMLTPGVTMVIAPLVVLMRDQCDNLYNRSNINAYDINGNKSEFFELYGNKNIDHANSKNIRMIPHAKTLYISPERFFNEDFLIVFDSLIKDLGEVVVDEVHCLSEWGHDFRTSYLMLFKFLRAANIGAKTLLVGTSATSSPRVTNDIIKEFESVKERVNVVKGQSLTRKELTFEVIKDKAVFDNGDKYSSDASFSSSLNVLKKIYKNDAAIHNKMLVFAAYAKSVSGIKLKLQQQGESEDYLVGTYVGNNTNDKYSKTFEQINEEKAVTYNQFKTGQIGCLVATKAFGMGVDIPDIRQTVHIDLASSVESMYQEMGRAGRDGKPSTCTVVYCSTPQLEAKITELENSNNVCLDGEDSRQYGPIGKQLFLMYMNNYAPQKECDFICKKLIPYLQSCGGTFNLYKIGQSIGMIDDKLKKGITKWDSYATCIDQSLYKLFILGIIPLWGLKYSGNIENPAYTGANVTIDLDEVVYHLEHYIQQFDFEYKYEKHQTDKTLENIVFELCKWNYDNYITYRFKSLFTLHEMVNSFTDSDSFMQRIENYFKDSTSLDKMISKPEDLQWLNVLLLDPSVLHDQLQRYVADYHSNPIVRYVDGITSVRIALAKDEKIPSRYLDDIASGVTYFSSIGNKVISDVLNRTFYAVSVDSSRAILAMLFDKFNKNVVDDSWKLKTELSKMNIISSEEFDETVQYYKVNDALMKLKSTIKAFNNGGKAVW